jgi:hypothetical protein
VGNSAFNRITWFVLRLVFLGIELLGLALAAGQEKQGHEEDILGMIVLLEFCRIVLVLKFLHTL